MTSWNLNAISAYELIKPEKIKTKTEPNITMKVRNSGNFTACPLYCLVVISLLFVNGSYAKPQEPVGILLTWQQDPTTTMTIDWHTTPDDQADPNIRYKLSGTSNWQNTTASNINFPFSDRIIHRVALTGLEPGSTYRFQVGEFQRHYKFETMPEALNEPLVFAVGGDTKDRGHEARQIWMERMNAAIKEFDPKFVVWGGDLAYADGLRDQTWRWYGWFEANMNTLITDQGRVIPIIVSIGNHEVKNSYVHRLDDGVYEQTDEFRKSVAPYFYSLFAFPGQPGYNVLDFGDYLSLPILDTDHTNLVAGKQTEWLNQVLSERQNVPHVFPVYHVPAYPSVRNFDGRIAVEIREHWVPLFDRYQVPMVFENHDHAYKRTPPIRHGEINPEGTVYIGDGAWGVQIRAPHNPDETWYLERASQVRHGIIVSLHGTRRYVQAVNENGEVFDEYPGIFPRPEAKARISSLLPDGGAAFSAEKARLFGEVYIDSDFNGYTGIGFAKFRDESPTGSSLVWQVPAEDPGEFRLQIRYANENNNQAMKLSVNGNDFDELALPHTGSWDRWEVSEFITIELDAGMNKIELARINLSAVHIDRIEIQPSTTGSP